MSLTLLLLRHAKSDWGATYGDDHERPLARRGQKAARRMGSFLVRAGMVPDAVLSSTAVRARTTVELAAEAGGWERPVRLSDRLYGGSAEMVLAEIARHPESVRVLLVAGHEPRWSELVAHLTGGRVRFPTAALACIRSPVESWAEVGEAGGELAWLVAPKLVGRALTPPRA